MSGDWIWIRNDDGRHERELDVADVCGNGHATVFGQQSWCPQCFRPTIVFRCSTSGCHWVVAGGRHYETECDPSNPDRSGKRRSGR